MMTDDRDMMRNLLREAAGPAPDPAPSRRAIRAALADGLARRRRHDKRVRVAGTLALSALLVAGLISPLGSDDFDLKLTEITRNGVKIDVYRQGFRGEEIRTTGAGSEDGLSRETVEDLFVAKLTTEAVPVTLSGFEVGGVRDIMLACEYLLPDGRIVSSSMKAGGKDRPTPPALQQWFGTDRAAKRAAITQVVGTAQNRAPDLTVPMHIDGIVWLVNGWVVRLPGRAEIIYYEGRRTDGVLPQAQD